MNRFMLNLRSFKVANCCQSDSDHQELSDHPLEFKVQESFLGNIGEPLEISHDGEDEYDASLGETIQSVPVNDSRYPDEERHQERDLEPRITWTSGWKLENSSEHCS